METNLFSYRIYYTDGSTWDSSMGEPWDAPRYGIQIIIMRHPDPQERPYLVWQGDYYIWIKDQWLPVDRFGFDMYYFNRLFSHRKAALAGEYTDNNNFEDIRKRAMSDPDFF